MTTSTLKNEMDKIEVHPVQMPYRRLARPVCPKTVTLAAYEVYALIHGPQAALIDMEGRGCRGGFGAGELIAFLYARSFPKTEWRERCDEALRGMELG